MYRAAATLLFTTFVFFLNIPAAHAQFAIPGAGSAITISTAPANPGPNTPVTLTVQSPLYDMDQSTITWTANGKVIANGYGETTAHIITGALGVATRVSVQITAPNGSASTDIAIIPSSIDLLWESSSYTPPFYKGRALPSAGSFVTLAAIPHLIRPGSGAIAADQLIYTWKKDGATITSASGRGKSSAQFESPMLFGNETISVMAASADGTISGQASIRIGDTQPQLVLYEDHPLFGIKNHQAIIATTYIPETEMSFVAIPYFAPVASTKDVALQYAWSVNQKAVAINTSKPNELTINADKSSGLAFIQLELTHANNYFFDAQNSWNVTFSKNASASGGSSTGIKDAFHP